MNPIYMLQRSDGLFYGCSYRDELFIHQLIFLCLSFCQSLQFSLCGEVCGFGLSSVMKLFITTS